MSDQPRPVWLTREQRDWLWGISTRNEFDDQSSAQIASAWDAAPADAEEAAYEALSPYTRSYRQWNERATEDVLRALGMPDV